MWQYGNMTKIGAIVLLITGMATICNEFLRIPPQYLFGAMQVAFAVCFFGIHRRIKSDIAEANDRLRHGGAKTGRMI